MLLKEDKSILEVQNSIQRMYEMSRITCKIIPTTITRYNCGRRTLATLSWPCNRLVNGTTINLQEITHPYTCYARHGSSALCPLCTPSHYILTYKCYKHFLPKKWVSSWYSEIQPLYFSETLGLQFCRTQAPLSITVALGKIFSSLFYIIITANYAMNSFCALEIYIGVQGSTKSTKLKPFTF